MLFTGITVFKVKMKKKAKIKVGSTQMIIHQSREVVISKTCLEGQAKKWDF